MLLGFSNHAGATIINLGDGAIHFTNLTITYPQNLVNTYLAWPALNVSSLLLGYEIGHLPNAEARDAVFKVSFLNNFKTADLDYTGSYLLGQSGRKYNNPAPVSEPSTMLLLGSSLAGLVGFLKHNGKS
jgi:hypothetical protein